MSIKKMEVRICDKCGNELIGFGVRTSPVPHEGCSEISTKDSVYYVGNEDFCDIECLFAHIKEELK